MKDIYASIANVPAEEISDVLNAVMRRYEALFPGWEVSAITLKKSENRNEQIDNMIRFMEKMKTFP